MSDTQPKSLALPESIHIAAVADLQVAIANLLETEDAAVEIDCSAVKSIDAAVLQCLLVNRRAAAARGTRLKLVQASEDFRRIAAYVGLVEELLAA
ncbi:MAG TPA: STAS domain-containing protein [Gammaproteobacteria bacterium]|nr:STAS domain-containing protein [Gammaproteobacteria bacterium]